MLIILLNFFKNESLIPEEINQHLIELGTVPLTQKVKMFNVLRSSSIRYL
ncbi:MAG: hypothetical protein KatS3mg035_1734 [Bacteroidia bacterium]|nr:MAG: hypothetical protein KatS3mg035_1734 [Bacteroidia bacterium]